MKKFMISVSCVSIVLLGVSVTALILFRPSKVENFRLYGYQYYIDKFPSDHVLSGVDNVEDVQKNAEILWTEIYGEGIKKKKPYQVFWDAENGVWLVQGTLHATQGGVPYMLIEKQTGKVLAIWHTK